MLSFSVLVGALLTISSVNAQCGCRHQPPPCYQEPAPSCGEPQGCAPCSNDYVPQSCPSCPAPVIPQCPSCPAYPPPPPCPMCPPQPVCQACEVCPPQIVPEPCQQCPYYPPPAPCAACPAPRYIPPQQCPPPPPQPSCSGGGGYGGGGYGGGYGYAPRARPLARPSYSSNDCCNQCGSSCSYRRRARMHGAATLVADVDPTCNSEKLRTIILSNIGNTTTESKRAIQEQANANFSAQFDVVCVKGEISYVISSSQFCQDTKDDMTCYVFRKN